MKTSESITAIAKALSAAQGEIKPAPKDAKNPFFNSKYSDLATVWEACRAALSKHGIAVIQSPESDGSSQKILVKTKDGSPYEIDGAVVKMITTLAHSSGEWMAGELVVIAKGSDPQSIGSAITYARRYALASMVGVCSEEDDDGNYASKPQDKAPAKPTPKKALSDMIRELAAKASSDKDAEKKWNDLEKWVNSKGPSESDIALFWGLKGEWLAGPEDKENNNGK